MKIKSIKNARNLVGKRVLLRVDFNVPVENGRIKDDYKIVRQLQTIRFLLRNKCKVIIISHLGRPLARNMKHGTWNMEHGTRNIKHFSVEPMVKRLGELLGGKVGFVDDCVGLRAGTAVSRMKNGQVIMLENIRFEPGEMKNSKILAKNLAKFGDIYVNDAFAVSHRAQASVSAIKNYLPSYAGLLLENELINLNKALNPRKPLVVVMGGAKIATKMAMLKQIHKKTEYVLIGGALANNFLSAHGLEVGQSLVDAGSIQLAKSLRGKKNIILPVDVIVSSKKGVRRAGVKNVIKVNKTDCIFDIGPKTISLYACLIKRAQTIIWNGPMGMFEDERFKHGTMSIARVIASRSSGKAFGAVGGGETVEALKKTKMIEHVDWVSTGGGAMLAYLGGERMSGIAGLVN